MTGGPIDTVRTPTIREYGILSGDCASAGDEFNPLLEFNMYGNNPWQDFSRGRIADYTTDENGEANVEPVELL